MIECMSEAVAVLLVRAQFIHLFFVEIVKYILLHSIGTLVGI